MGVARTMWKLFEPIHVITYFDQRCLDRFTEAGLRGFWRGYFAGRVAPFGAVGPAPVIAAFYTFAPHMVTRALPAVWELAAPAEVLRARAEGAVSALTARVPDLPVAHIEEAADLLERAVVQLDPAGRVLGAANQGLPPYTDPYARLFQATTTLREHRGDGHVAALVTVNLGPLEVLTLRCGRDLGRDAMQAARGWSDEEWSAAQARMVERGLLGTDHRITPAGEALFGTAEDATNVAAEAPWTALGDPAVARLRELLEPITVACRAALPPNNPIGIPVS